jgi:hypothetical protein
MGEGRGDERLDVEDVEDQDYDTFLETWAPSERLIHASLEQHLNDPFSRVRMLEDNASRPYVERSKFVEGETKAMVAEELIARRYDFFVKHQRTWAAGFRDYLLHHRVPTRKVAAFIKGMATLWVGPPADRQNSPLMRGIKASIRDLDRLNFPSTAGKFTLKPVDDSVEPFFTPEEMRIVFEANAGLIDAYLPDYVDVLRGEGPGAVGGLYVRRGMRLETAPPALRHELHELNSYSLGIGAVEQFAQLWRRKTKNGVSVIVSAPLPAVQTRIVAFAPFISKMTLGQLELVVAPPVSETPLVFQDQYDGIGEYLFE